MDNIYFIFFAKDGDGFAKKTKPPKYTLEKKMYKKEGDQAKTFILVNKSKIRHA